ncbi:hypothetical protein KCP73_07270 [Salmonella enterica subsp. enterica]|nr:hypothetical protein KCP73_07270 [Salmonella enterica subsp. enterica]
MKDQSLCRRQNRETGALIAIFDSADGAADAAPAKAEEKKSGSGSSTCCGSGEKTFTFRISAVTKLK